ncbi:MAG TPA: PIG-L family deacetylase [Tepidiformaceae bacterium]|jgi:LmbE family N-acetylglucosaminyl deacetylase|nr:PIG-L family deacetylase [Tepidiformaceae bacterium]
MKDVRIMAVYGHPDDEGQATGTLAAFAARGAHVTLVCATRGEVGEISDPSLATPETLGYVRELELRAAMAQIGVFDVRFLPFRDSGMAGTPENQDPRCLNAQQPEIVVGQLVALMRQLRPHIVFTWDPSGGYGHPDHIAVHRHTLAAFDACGDPAHFRDAGVPWEPGRLYWGAFPMKRFAGIYLELERRGLLPEGLDPERRTRFEQAMAAPDAAVSHVVDVREFTEAKRAAAGMHRSQFGENSLFARIPEDLRTSFYGEERFYQARPAVASLASPHAGLEALLPPALG